jgi:hypothetical protein
MFRDFEAGAACVSVLAHTKWRFDAMQRVTY